MMIILVLPWLILGSPSSPNPSPSCRSSSPGSPRVAPLKRRHWASPEEAPRANLTVSKCHIQPKPGASRRIAPVFQLNGKPVLYLQWQNACARGRKSKSGNPPSQQVITKYQLAQPSGRRVAVQRGTLSRPHLVRNHFFFFLKKKSSHDNKP